MTDVPPSNTTYAGLTTAVSTLVQSDQEITYQFLDIVNGSATGGYNADGTVSNNVAPNGGYYPINDRLGVTHYLPSIAKLLARTSSAQEIFTEMQQLGLFNNFASV